jgi:glycolate oxidase FAD binding subunit
MSPAVVADRIVDAVTAAGVDARPAGQADQVDGVAAAAVAFVRDTSSAAAAVRVAAEQGLTVVARGTATKLTWGAPPDRVDLLLDTSRMADVVEHAAGDLVLHVQAGIALDAVQHALAGAGQRLAIDPALPENAPGPGTVGGTIAVAAAGPLRHSHGAVRDLLIGITFVRADGTVAKAGGKVVKNVAGYDLAKLLAGSWGTLGVITEAVFRLHPAPQASRWVICEPLDPHTLDRVVQAVVQSQLVPAAIEIDRTPDGQGSVAVLFEGFEDGIGARVDGALAIMPGASAHVEPPAWWGRLPGRAESAVLKLTSEIAALPAVLSAVDRCGADVTLRGSPGVGVMHAAVDGDAAVVVEAVRSLRSRRAHWGGDVVVLDAPRDLKAAVDVWGPVRGLELMRRVKDQFDPDHRLAPGRFVGGI